MANFRPVAADVLEKLRGFDTPTVCNVIELFDIRPRNRGYMDCRIKCNFPELPPIVGFACTASFRSDAPPAGGDAYGSIGAQLDQFAKLAQKQSSRFECDRFRFEFAGERQSLAITAKQLHRRLMKFACPEAAQKAVVG